MTEIEIIERISRNLTGCRIAVRPSGIEFCVNNDDSLRLRPVWWSASTFLFGKSVSTRNSYHKIKSFFEWFSIIVSRDDVSGSYLDNRWVCALAGCSSNEELELKLDIFGKI